MMASVLRFEIRVEAEQAVMQEGTSSQAIWTGPRGESDLAPDPYEQEWWPPTRQAMQILYRAQSHLEELNLLMLAHADLTSLLPERAVLPSMFDEAVGMSVFLLDQTSLDGLERN